jgi:hypothetical protein
MLLLLSLIWLNSCKDKSSEIDFNPNVLSSKDYVRGEDAILEIVNAFLKGIYDTLVCNNGYGHIDACDVCLDIPNNSMTFGYGPVNRLCLDDKFRRGLFRASFTGEIFIEGVTASLVTDSLFVDDLPVEASIQIRNLGINDNNLPEYSLKVISSSIMLPDSNRVNGVSITTDFIMVWAEGSESPPIHEDDIYHIRGTASGVSSDGVAFSLEIQEPLVNDIECFWISQGFSRIHVPVAKFTTGDIDYIIEDGCFNEIYFYFNDNLFYDVIK